MSINIALIGCGSIGTRHLKNIIQLVPDVVKVYVYDKSPERLAAAQSISTKVTACPTRLEILEKPVDLAFICTPSHLHFDDSMDFIKKRIPVFIEKPACLNSRDCMTMLETARAPVIVGCNMRYHPAVKEARHLVLSEKLGEVISARAFFGHSLKNWRPGTNYKQCYSAKALEGGGALWDGIHELDYIMWLFGDVDSVHAFYSAGGILGIAAEEIGELILRHKNNIISNIHLDYIQPVKRRGLEIVGSKATFLWTSIGKNPEHLKIEIFSNSVHPDIICDSHYDINKAYINELLDILKLLHGAPLDHTDLLDISMACREVQIIELLKRDNYNE